MMAEEIPPHTISDMANLSVIPSLHVFNVYMYMYIHAYVLTCTYMYMYMLYMSSTHHTLY